MMANKYYIVDTNIFIAANGKADQLTENDVNKCKLFVTALFSNTTISIDLQGEIFKEYFDYMNWSGQPGIGDVFVKYLWDRQYDKKICELVDINKDKNGIYKQLRNKDDLLQFDPNEHKFIAVYLGSRNSVTICNACDSDWENNKSLLSKYQINILEILHEETQRQKNS
jgi:hypothetical protein